ncbi:hypothetical protein BDQ17DRAFT_475789 [Cyathus striatus]|nr:hypothetical protein BDQ17DRAFT_475789 [Cyathus striatus]
MDLLSPSESQAFKTFLSSIDYNDALPAPEWGMYATSMGEDLLLEDIPQGKEALTKATKDLMSLDYAHHGHHGHHFQPQHHHHPFQYSHGTHQAYDEQRHREQQHQQSQNQQQATYASTRHESFPFLQSSKPSHNHSHQHNQRQVHQQHSFHHPSQHVTPVTRSIPPFLPRPLRPLDHRIIQAQHRHPHTHLTRSHLQQDRHCIHSCSLLRPHRRPCRCRFALRRREHKASALRKGQSNPMELT